MLRWGECVGECAQGLCKCQERAESFGVHEGSVSYPVIACLLSPERLHKEQRCGTEQSGADNLSCAIKTGSGCSSRLARNSSSSRLRLTRAEGQSYSNNQQQQQQQERKVVSSCSFVLDVSILRLSPAHHPIFCGSGLTGNRNGSSGDAQLTRTSLYLTFLILSVPSQSPGPGCMVLTLSVRTVSRAEGWSRAHREVTLL